MKTIIVDDERWGLERFAIECGNMEDIELLGMFQNPFLALEVANKQRVELALLDIQMPGMNGMDLADKLRETYPDIIIIFVSAYEEYYKEAMKNRKADYFLLKPYTGEEVKEVLQRAKLLSARQKKRVVIRTFGYFTVFVDNKPVKFTSPKAEELLAVLVDAAGEPVTSESAFEQMWETLPYNHTEAGRYRRALQKLQNTLKTAGIENIISAFPHARAINKDMVECDYFDLLAGNPETLKNWNTYYMNQYSWGEKRYGKIRKLVLMQYPEKEKELLIKEEYE